MPDIENNLPKNPVQTRADAWEPGRDAQYIEADVFFPLVMEVVNSGKLAMFTPRGLSMRPTLRHGRDTVSLKAAPEVLQKYDIVLYRVDSGKYILHRIVGVRSPGEYIVCGDGLTRLEFVPRRQILAVVESFRRGRLHVVCGKSRLYRLYSWFWVSTRLPRRVAIWVLRPVWWVVRRCLLRLGLIKERVI